MDSSLKDGILIKTNESKKNVGKSSGPKKKKGMIAGIIAGAVVVVLVIGTAAAGLYINKLDTIYPNVAVGGVNLSGMTVEEAKKALSEAGYDKNAEKIAVTVNFPDGEKMTITGDEAGLRLQTDQAAQLAYDYGKGGSFLSNEFNYIKSLFKSNELNQTGAAAIDEDYVRAVVKDYTKRFNDKLMKSAYTIGASSIDFVKGAGGALADADALFDLVIDALNKSVTQNSPVTVDYTLKEDPNGGVDLQSIYETIFVEPVDAVYDKTTDSVTDSVKGVRFDVITAQRVIDAAQMGTTVSIPLIFTQPAVTTEQLQSLLFRDVLSEKSTYVSGTSNRIHNVKLAASAVNQTVLNPDDVFSYNETLGERTAAKGYLAAGAYVGGEVVQEIGGGICQMSSTLYYCVLYSDLEVVTRSNHMFTVGYLPLGHDATVNWGTVDFKFKNDTEYPVRIESYYKDGYLTVRIYGTKTDTNKVVIKYVQLSQTAIETEYKEDPTIAPGTTKVETSGHAGYKVETYKYIYDVDGNLLSKTFIAPSTYRMQKKVILVAPGELPPDPNAPPSPSPEPSESPTTSPSSEPSESPTTSPSSEPSESPTTSPSPEPSESASPTPSESTSPTPSETPSPSPSDESE